MLFPVLLFIVGLVCLIKGGDWFVDGSTGIARNDHADSGPWKTIQNSGDCTSADLRGILHHSVYPVIWYGQPAYRKKTPQYKNHNRQINRDTTVVKAALPLFLTCLINLSLSLTVVDSLPVLIYTKSYLIWNSFPKSSDKSFYAAVSVENP